MADSLKMPDSLARSGVQGNQTICEEIVADTVGAVEIKRGRAGRSEEDATQGIERHPGPIVCGAAGHPRILGPSVIAKFAGRRRESLGVASTDNHKIFVDDGWTGQDNGLGGSGFAAEAFPEVDSAFFCKRRNGFAGGSVQSVEEVHYSNQDSLVLSIGPVGEAAIRLRATNSGVELPK